MKIFFDYQCFDQRVGGVSRVVVEHIKNFSDSIVPIVPILASDNIYLKEIESRISNGGNNSKGCEIFPVPFSFNRFLPAFSFSKKYNIYCILTNKFKFLKSFTNVNRPYAISVLKQRDFDIFHCPVTSCSDYFLPYIKDIPMVLTVHDMISELYYDNCSDIKKRLVERADHIIAISERTKDDLITLFKVPEKKVSVVYHGSPVEIPISDPIVKGDYMLYVGRRKDIYKNFTQTLLDFSEVHKTHPNLRFICVGPKFCKEEFDFISDLHLVNSVLSMQPTDEELANLYRYATGFIYPSTYEGFGLPILEAYTYQCPLLCNNKSCLPEIAGNAAIYFDSEKGQSNLPAVMDSFLKMSKSERKSYIDKGLSRKGLFSWKKAASQIEEIYSKIW